MTLIWKKASPSLAYHEAGARPFVGAVLAWEKKALSKWNVSNRNSPKPAGGKGHDVEGEASLVSQEVKNGGGQVAVKRRGDGGQVAGKWLIYDT